MHSTGILHFVTLYTHYTDISLRTILLQFIKNLSQFLSYHLLTVLLLFTCPIRCYTHWVVSRCLLYKILGNCKNVHGYCHAIIADFLYMLLTEMLHVFVFSWGLIKTLHRHQEVCTSWCTGFFKQESKNTSLLPSASPSVAPPIMHYILERSRLSLFLNL